MAAARARRRIVSIGTCHGSRGAAAGFTLIEIVITLVLIAIALLGLAELQARGANLQKGAFDRKAAAAATRGLAERMRANPAGWVGNQYALAWAPGTPVSSATSCASSSCTAATLASIDLSLFEQELASQLTSAGALVAQGADSYNVIVVWSEPRVWKDAANSAIDADPICNASSSALSSGGLSLASGTHCYAASIFP